MTSKLGNPIPQVTCDHNTIQIHSKNSITPQRQSKSHSSLVKIAFVTLIVAFTLLLTITFTTHVFPTSTGLKQESNRLLQPSDASTDITNSTSDLTSENLDDSISDSNSTSNSTSDAASETDSDDPDTYYLRNVQEGWIYNRDNSPLAKMCNQTQWKSNLYLYCSNVAGGLFNVRGEMMSCIRWAIDAGIGVILPTIATRFKNDPTRWYENWVGVDHFFDSGNIKRVLQEQCPQLQVLDNKNGIGNQIISNGAYFTQYYPGSFKAHIEELLRANNWDYNNSVPTIIQEGNPLWGWEFYREHDINQIMLNVVQFNPSIANLATPLISKLPSKYLGFHLRAEADNIWHTYDQSLQWFKTKVLTEYPDYNTIYVATGDRGVENRFRETMQALNYTVVSKWTLADGNQDLVNAMSSYKFDQVAIVDYEILKRSSHFFGTAESSFDHGISFYRGNQTITNCDCDLVGRTDFLFICCY